ncbi:hypothetical protein MC7420_116 [Coleofasciculus chthonoplastes PCC 7420]|uniref:Uncharacterized protein n=1 Tax=Coleofasciculus chthonoplastes PCC 7420 TaxID=118168 RepID=B4W4R5_9CYAN|nr:hypothetical protein MC7420_116 [Coleofasciculus chthonoplastes PCC 7420]
MLRNINDSLPIGLNRISWKPFISETTSSVTLPIGLNRISWKRIFLLRGKFLFSPTDWVKSD